MVFVLEEPSYFADTAKLLDDRAMIGHTHDVHRECTSVNVEIVPLAVDNPPVPDDESTGAALGRLRLRAGLSVREFAQASGYSHGSGVQRYLEEAYTKRLPMDVAERMATALEGKGRPPIERNEVLVLAGIPVSNALPIQLENNAFVPLSHDVPIYGTALGSDELIDGEAVEQTMLNSSEVIGYLRRPSILGGRKDVYGLYVQGSSMHPRYKDGATVFVESRRLPAVGEDAVIYLRIPDEQDGERPCAVLIKSIVRKSGTFVELEQYNPPLCFRIPMARISKMDRVIPWDELVA